MSDAVKDPTPEESREGLEPAEAPSYVEPTVPVLEPMSAPIPIPNLILVRTSEERKPVFANKLDKVRDRWRREAEARGEAEVLYLQSGESIEAQRLNLQQGDLVVIRLAEWSAASESLVRVIRDAIHRACPAWGGEVLVALTGAPIDLEKIPKNQARGLWMRLRSIFRPDHEELVRAAGAMVSALEIDGITTPPYEVRERLRAALRAVGGV